jgi:two-component system LytT family response regulator
MRVVIIDDEPKARNLLKTILEESCREITEIYEADDLPSGVISINKTKPNIVFLDVEMPNYLGTQILDFFGDVPINFQLIFTTAYSEYAIKAFELNAISYLLKPLRPSQVKEAVEKAVEFNLKNKINNQIIELDNTLKTNTFSKIGLPVADGVQFIKLSDITFFKADGMYTNVHIVDNETLLISKPLKYFVEILAELPQFYRSHRSFLINKNHINQLVKKDGGYIVMDNNEIVSVAKDKLNELSQVKEI